MVWILSMMKWVAEHAARRFATQEWRKRLPVLCGWSWLYSIHPCLGSIRVFGDGLCKRVYAGSGKTTTKWGRNELALLTNSFLPHFVVVEMGLALFLPV